MLICCGGAAVGSCRWRQGAEERMQSSAWRTGHLMLTLACNQHSQRERMHTWVHRNRQQHAGTRCKMQASHSNTRQHMKHGIFLIFAVAPHPSAPDPSQPSRPYTPCLAQMCPQPYDLQTPTHCTPSLFPVARGPGAPMLHRSSNPGHTPPSAPTPYQTAPPPTPHLAPPAPTAPNAKAYRYPITSHKEEETTTQAPTCWRAGAHVSPSLSRTPLCAPA